MDIQSPSPSTSSKQQNLGGILARIFWMMLGNFTLLMLLAVISQKARNWSLAGVDWAYWIILGLMIAVRYVDITRLDGETVYGERATRRDWWHYAVKMLLIGGGCWAAAHGLAIYLHHGAG